MNILIVSQYFWPETFRINDVAQGLVDRGHKITVLTGKPNYPKGHFYPGYHFLNKNRELYNSINIIRSPIIPRGKNKIQLALNYLSFAFFASFVGIFRCGHPDVIFIYEPSPITVALPAIFIKKIKKIPILFWVQDLWPESVVTVGAVSSKNLLKWLEWLVCFIYKRCDYILATSMAYFDPIKRFDVPETKLRYFPQTAEDLYKPIENAIQLSEENLLPRGFRIIFSGNIGKAQDIETIIKAALEIKHHKQIKWIFLGDGSKRKWLEKAIKQHELSETVLWLGQYPVESMPRFFSCANALLVTLKNDPVCSLAIPAKIQSYLACAKPIIGALDGEGRRVIEEAQAGIVTASGDFKKLADIALKMYALSADDQKKMGMNGQNYFLQNFQRDVLLKKLENWMNELREK